jgi:hypothetical protein
VKRSGLPQRVNRSFVETWVSRTLKDFHLADISIFVDHGFHHDFPLGSIDPS